MVEEILKGLIITMSPVLLVFLVSLGIARALDGKNGD